MPSRTTHASRSHKNSSVWSTTTSSAPRMMWSRASIPAIAPRRSSRQYPRRPSTPLLLVAGVNYDDLAEARKGYLNYIGQELGVEGALRRDEANNVYDFDQYLQAQWDQTPRWRMIAGVRNNLVEVTSHGHIPVLDGVDSSVRYSAVNPVAGVTFRATSAVNLYASYGKGFETPTLNDLAYRSTNGSLPGLNIGLRPARSNNFEVGVKAGDERLHANLAGFYIKTEDELAV